MKTLYYKKKNLLEWVDIDEPSISGKNQMIVEPIAIARCDLDLPIIQGATLFRPNFPIGHEFIGRVVEVSEDIQDQFIIGSSVAVSFQVSCGICPSCVDHQSKNCKTNKFVADFGMPPGAHEFGGAISEKVKIPYATQMVLPISQNLDPISIASLSDNISEAWKLAGRFFDRKPNGKILVVGGLASSIGLYTALLAHQMYSGEILYWDTDRKRVDLAESLGIPSIYSDAFPKSEGRFDIVCEASNTEEGWSFAMRSIEKNGIFSSGSLFWSNKISIPYLELYNFGVEMHLGRVDSIESMRKLLPSIESGQFTPGKIVTSIASFTDAKDAWLEPSIKLVIRN
ncbi:zinc-dependent alcohol dehydrogenase [Leptospira sp. GIMC2001]|uniref:zinc-dependent alcohol dehydrogenase n=1 Tax=Leptospira sp. GIMC2001 TaxID=1513297 RepID=UPI00234AD8C0|nr:alcohol dehydrogenase catalytic domain-containing protein [Leptospira sp. GIMC2001]WCL48603.1 alcohol dehydrogenase catalytic domain-containing protein [Leptospira sp. GIMC2001]